VFFRDTTRDVAGRLGLTGWVRNRGDGRVEAEFQGSPGAVAQAVEFCRTGPHHADVAGVQVTDVDVIPGEKRFQVR